MVVGIKPNRYYGINSRIQFSAGPAGSAQEELSGRNDPWQANVNLLHCWVSGQVVIIQIEQKMPLNPTYD
jgi:hypothetical protein